MRVLIIDNDSVSVRSMELMMRSEGMATYASDLGEEGYGLGKLYEYDLITLDLNMPDMNGLDVLRRLRAAKVRTPVLVVTAASAIETKLAAFKAGADDYMTKPFHKDELIARIHAVVRRSRGHDEPVLRSGNLTLDLGQHAAEVDGKPIHLTGKEYQMLELLMLRKGNSQTKDNFLNHLYGGRDEPEIKIVDVFICKLRKKLNAAGCTVIVETNWGRGYTLKDPPEAPAKAGVAQAAEAA